MKMSRDHIILSINGRQHEIRGEHAFMNLSEYLRYQAGLAGTKIVCAEGDCGACSVLVAKTSDPIRDQPVKFKSINSCIQPVFNLDGCIVVTVEALASAKELSAVQQSMVDQQGAQCGYCTPGICISLSYLKEQTGGTAEEIIPSKAKNFLTGNLCRCTGYEPIIKAACGLIDAKESSLSKRFLTASQVSTLKGATQTDVYFGFNRPGLEPIEVWIPSSKESLFGMLGKGRLISGATDLGVQRNKGRLGESRFISLQKIAELKQAVVTNGLLRIGAGLTWDQVQDFLQDDFSDFADSINLFASPQIKHIGTLAGNIINASPIADGVPFLLVNEAELLLLGSGGKERRVPISDFYQGYKKIGMASDEILWAVLLPKNKLKQRVYKVSQRKDLDIATINLAIAYELKEGVFSHLKLAFGGVAETSLRMTSIESLALGRKPDALFVADCAKAIDLALRPLSDVRGSSKYRMLLAKNLIQKWVVEIDLESQQNVNEANV